MIHVESHCSGALPETRIKKKEHLRGLNVNFCTQITEVGARKQPMSNFLDMYNITSPSLSVLSFKLIFFYSIDIKSTHKTHCDDKIDYMISDKKIKVE